LQIIVIGAGGHATSLAESILSCGYEILYFVDKYRSKDKLLGYKVVKNIPNSKSILNIVIAIGDNSKRFEIYKIFLNKMLKINFPSIIHPSASISKFAKIGSGTVVLQNAVVGSNCKIGKFCIVNSSSSVDHDCKMSNFSSLGPASVTGGNVNIGLRSAVGINSSILQKVDIGKDVVVGSNSFVNQNIKSNVVVYGSPAKIIRKRDKDSNYL
tara:strand:- start:632 stop:1267 length:636 start_codon:yes stop_codon:yes gene_type:complete